MCFGAKFLVSKNWEGGEGKREFVFKQAGTPSPVFGYPTGSDTPREVLADTVAQVLKGVTGLDFPMPETRIIGIDPSKLGKKSGEPDVLGTAQVSVETVGSVRDLYGKDKDLLKKIPLMKYKR